MQLAHVRLQGFRNLDCSVKLCAPLSLVVGENNNGKSNLIDAIRVVLRALGHPRDQLWVTAEDFPHDGRGARISDTFEIEAVFTDLDQKQCGRMVSCLSLSSGNNVARLRLRAHLDSRDRPVLEWFGGDDDHEELEGFAQSMVAYTYLRPLRDALSDLRPGRSNRLARLLKALIGEGPDGESSPDRKLIEDIVRDTNRRLMDVTSIVTARREIQQRVDKILGAGYRQQIDLAFAKPELDRIIRAIRLLAGDLDALELAENGLGYNNVLYMATLLAELAEEPGEELHLLLIEEPEAHLHPQLQDLLTRYLESAATGRIQVIVTTHSPNIAAATGVERITALTRPTRHAGIVSRDLNSFRLTPAELGHLRRFLDVTKASLLFARGVLLVEGVAEQLLVPVLAETVGISLAKAGVSVINIGGLAFKPFAKLFHPDRLPYRCAIVSDGDRLRHPVDNETDAGPQPVDEPTEPALSHTAQTLRELQNDNLHVYLSDQTFEWDLVRYGNWEACLQALKLLKPRVAAQLRAEHAESRPDVQAWELLGAVKDSKGLFAQALTQIAADGVILTVPPYLEQALWWVAGPELGAAEGAPNGDAGGLRDAEP